MIRQAWRLLYELERVEEWVDILGDDELKVEELRGFLLVSGVRSAQNWQARLCNESSIQQSYPVSSHTFEVFLRS